MNRPSVVQRRNRVTKPSVQRARKIVVFAAVRIHKGRKVTSLDQMNVGLAAVRLPRLNVNVMAVVRAAKGFLPDLTLHADLRAGGRIVGPSALGVNTGAA